MGLTTSRESTNEIASPKTFFPDSKSKDFTRERTQKSNIKNYNLIDKIDKFAFTYSKIEKQFAHEYHHWGAKKKIMDIIIK